jgi:AhpD family alkylhydroperoxidase
MDDSLDAQFAATMGAAPQQMKLMRDLDEEFAQRYGALREVVFRDRDGGLDAAVKELLFIALSVAAGNVNGIHNHMGPALRAGVTRSQLAETLMLVMLVDGVGAWGATGVEAWETWLATVAEQQAGSHDG